MKYEVIRGDTQTVQIDFTEYPDEDPADISSWEFWLTVKKRLTDIDAQAVIQKAPENFSISSGVASVVLSSSDTKIPVGSYFYDVQVKIGGAIFTPIRGRLIIKSEVTLSE